MGFFEEKLQEQMGLKRGKEEEDLSEFVGPIKLKLEMVKTSAYGPRMRSTKKNKMIFEKSIFQKVYF